MTLHPSKETRETRGQKPGETRGQTERFLLSCAVARLARVVAVDVPHHVTQRGNARQETRGQTERLLLSCAVARLARVVAVDVPHHVTQRGNARQYILDSDADRMVYLDLLRCHAQLHELSLVGYCLMSHHVHLVAIPVATGDSRVCRQHPRAFFSSRHCSG